MLLFNNWSNTMEWMTTEQAAEYLMVKEATMMVWRSRGDGPEFFKQAGVIRYTKESIDRWMESGRREPGKGGK